LINEFIYFCAGCLCLVHVLVLVSFTVSRNKDEITRDTLSDVSLIVFGASRDEFSTLEASELTDWLNGGGRILMCFTDGAEIEENVNLKKFLTR
jgi:hypothetical protein